MEKKQKVGSARYRAIRPENAYQCRKGHSHKPENTFIISAEKSAVNPFVAQAVPVRKRIKIIFQKPPLTFDKPKKACYTGYSPFIQGVRLWGWPCPLVFLWSEIEKHSSPTCKFIMPVCRNFGKHQEFRL